MSFNRPWHGFLRKLMFLWVRVDTLPKQLPPEDWCGRPVLYVMAGRGLSDLLVLEDIARRHHLPDPLQRLGDIPEHHSVYSVATRSPLSEWLRQQPKRSRMLEDLLERLQQEPEFDLCLVPVSVFWGRPIARERHWLQVLFADTWALGGRLRKLLTILVNGRHTTLIFSPAVSLRELAERSEHSAEDLNQALTDILQRQHEATFGPRIPGRAQMIQRLVDAPELQQTLQQLAETRGEPVARLRKEAIGYCQEIIANPTQISLEIMRRLLDFFWRRFYSGIETFDIERIKPIALTHQLVYVPCHRSHVDYLLLSYVIFHEGLALPYIAAGDNLNIPIVGRLLRGGGAFFIRRSFRDNPLYGAVLNQYLRELVGMGVALEYFIEGGRSRTGRLLPPKLGMLSMTAGAWLETRNKPLAFVPVYIGYEKLIEGNAYLGELYGQKKKKESLFATIKSILLLKGQFGKVTTRFGEPIELEDWFARQQPGWQQQPQDDVRHQPWFRQGIAALGQEVMLSINRAAVINPVNLIATTLLATPRQSIDEQEVIRQCALYHELIDRLPSLASVRLQDRVDNDELRRIEQQGLMHIREHPLGNIVFLKPEDAVLMSYYRNNSLHTLIIPSLLACCFTNARALKPKRLRNLIHYVYPFLAAEWQLPWDEQALDGFIDEIIAFLVGRQLLIEREGKLRRPDRSDAHYLLLIRLGAIVQPVLERYYMTFAILWENGEKPISEADLEQRCHLVAQKISMIYGNNSPDFFDRQLFRHFIHSLRRLGFVEKDEQGLLRLAPDLEGVNIDIRLLLSLEVRSTILQLLRSNQETGEETNTSKTSQ